MGAEVAATALAVTTAATFVVPVVAGNSTQRQASNAKNTANATAAAEVAERTRLAEEHAAAVNAEAQRQASLAIKNQQAQNARINMLASEAADSEMAVARNILERTQEEAGILVKDAARESERIEGLKLMVEGKQVSSLAAGGVDLSRSGTAGVIHQDTETRAAKDQSALKESTQSKLNLLQKTGEFAMEQGKTSARNILESASNTTLTNMENVNAWSEALIYNAKISGETEKGAAEMQNLMTMADANRFSFEVDRLKSSANAQMWGQLLQSTANLIGTSGSFGSGGSGK